MISIIRRYGLEENDTEVVKKLRVTTIHGAQKNLIAFAQKNGYAIKENRNIFGIYCADKVTGDGYELAYN